MKTLLLLVLTILHFFQVNSQSCHPDAMVSIRSKTTDKNISIHISAGILIHPRWVLSVAESLMEFFPEELYVAGGPSIARNIENYNDSLFEVNEIFIHPDFKRKMLRYNVGLLLLNSPLKIVKAADIPSGELDSDISAICGDSAITMRWDLNESAYDLACSPVKFSKFIDCFKKYMNGTTWMVTKTEHECVNETNELWAGDKGSPLMCNGVYYAFASFQTGLDYPAAYTRIDKHLDFIQDTIKNPPTYRAAGARPSYINNFWLFTITYAKVISSIINRNA